MEQNRIKAKVQILWMEMPKKIGGYSSIMIDRSVP
jgi:hypothetical protein